MFLAFKQAQLSYSLGEVPVGAVTTNQKGEIIAEGHNQTILNKDPTAHAEIIALRRSALKLGNHRLVEINLYVTLEPCIMCLGAISQARVSKVVFGAFDSKYADSFNRRYLFKYMNHKMLMYGGVLSGLCNNILRNFFEERRQKSFIKSKSFPI